MNRFNGKWLLGLSGLLLLAGCGEEPPPPVDPQLALGEQVVKANCFVCHGQGINNAPVIGSIKAWGPRKAQGEEVLFQHATEGYNMMPARGGNEALTDDDIRAAIHWMLSQLPAE